MNTIKVPFQDKGHIVRYKVETIDLPLEALSFLNVYSVFIDDPELQKITGDHFTILHNMNQMVLPVFSVNNPNDVQETNLKKEIAQQIMNNPTE